MKRLSITILLLVYVLIQLSTFGWILYKPFVHAVCYNHFRTRSRNKGENEFVIKTELGLYQKALQDKNEILWEGELYDINSITQNGNEITLVVEKDITETWWVDAYNKIQQHINNNKSSQSPTDFSCCVWMFKLYLPSENINSNTAILPATPKNSGYISAFNSVFYPDGTCQPPDTIG